MNFKYIITGILLLKSGFCFGQIDPTLLKRVPKDTGKPSLNMDAVYQRPFLTMDKLPVAIGGYAEANYQHLGTDGVTEGHQFQFRRLSLFVASSVSKRIKFMTEIELENEVGDADAAGSGPETEIGIEYAALDVALHPLLNFRGGIILNPIGGFNQNHDGPKWEFTDRPIAMTRMLPATFSNAGFGLYGKHYSKNWMFGYELYLTGGFDNSVIDNTQNKTYLPAAKDNNTRLVGSASGKALITAKLAIRYNKIGELGLSYMGGGYNKTMADGLQIDAPRRLDVMAVDFNTTLPRWGTYIVGEWAWIKVELPPNYSQQYGSRQQGGFMDMVQPVVKRNILGWEHATINLALRLEYADWNVGRFETTGTNIGDALWSIMPAISFRPTAQTVFRVNYRLQWQRDLLDNPPSRTAGIIMGISSYF